MSESTAVTTLTDASALQRGPRVVTIGTFDGVHRGHRYLLDRARERGRTLGVRVLAVTFEPVPAMVLRPDKFPGRICAAAEKQAQLAASGVDEILTIAFTLELSHQSPEEFMEGLVKATGLRELWVGEAFALGRNRVGDVPRLTEIGRQLGYDLVAVPRVTAGVEVISSSAIRAAVLAGDAATAARLLGRPFRVGGEVIHGAHLGRTIGYPTANVVPPRDLVPLADGIYVALATLPDGAGPRPAMTYIGTRPTVNTGERQVETHLLDFDGDLYGLRIEVDVLERLRGDAAFEGVEALIAQLRRDEAATRAYFAERAGGADAANL